MFMQKFLRQWIIIKIQGSGLVGQVEEREKKTKKLSYESAVTASKWWYKKLVTWIKLFWLVVLLLFFCFFIWNLIKVKWYRRNSLISERLMYTSQGSLSNIIIKRRITLPGNHFFKLWSLRWNAGNVSLLRKMGDSSCTTFNLDGFEWVLPSFK